MRDWQAGGACRLGYVDSDVSIDCAENVLKCTWGVDRGCRAEASKESHAAILLSCNLLLLLVRLLLGFQQAHNRGNLLQLCLITCMHLLQLKFLVKALLGRDQRHQHSIDMVFLLRKIM